mmetsp:Transcript_87641/g.183261  ORF Transcript_87641/g.183261 Transcript_87641/m.183261 type:complete len:205 (-) Transcript_87641:148-762(-)
MAMTMPATGTRGAFFAAGDPSETTKIQGGMSLENLSPRGPSSLNVYLTVPFFGSFASHLAAASARAFSFSVRGFASSGTLNGGGVTVTAVGEALGDAAAGSDLAVAVVEAVLLLEEVPAAAFFLRFAALGSSTSIRKFTQFFRLMIQGNDRPPRSFAWKQIKAPPASTLSTVPISPFCIQTGFWPSEGKSSQTTTRCSRRSSVT